MEVEALPLDSFHLFTLLPPELRLRIWDFSLPDERLLPVRCHSDLDEPVSQYPASLGNHGAQYDPRYSKPKKFCTSVAPIPSNLHACAESRAHALSRYRLSFSYTRQPSQIYFRPETDVLYFGPRPGYMAAHGQLQSFFYFTEPEDLARVRRIAIDDALFWTTHYSTRYSQELAGPRPWSSNTYAIYHEAGHMSYWSTLAVSLTVDVLREIRRRMPALEEIIFVPHGATWANDPQDVRDTLGHQVQTALNDFLDQDGDWENMPKWTILPCPLSAPLQVSPPYEAPSTVMEDCFAVDQPAACAIHELWV